MAVHTEQCITAEAADAIGLPRAMLWYGTRAVWTWHLPNWSESMNETESDKKNELAMGNDNYYTDWLAPTLF